ncbi:MAG: hypothetical protein KDK06_19270, partial [Gammaproteobacteria bacterium]|nr:hypothetical protein [Gammaproteobacteria bacterium]
MSRPDGLSAATCVAVYDEPDHKAEIANDFVYAYRVRIVPGAHTLWHRHTEDTVYFALAAARAQEELPAQDAVVTEIPCNVAVSRPHKADPLVHRVTNRGAAEFHMVGAEALARPPGAGAGDAPPPGWTLALETPRFLVWRGATGCAAWAPARPGLVVAVAACALADGRPLAPAGLLWAAADDALTLPAG